MTLLNLIPCKTDLFKVNNRNTRKRCEMCSKLTIKTYFTPFSSVSIVAFEQVILARITSKNLFSESIKKILPREFLNLKQNHIKMVVMT